MKLTSRLTVLLAPLLAATLLTPATPAAASGPEAIDVRSVTIAHHKSKIAFTFSYASAPKDLWWGADLFFDTNPKRKGPEFAAFIDNQCGSGITVGPVKKQAGLYQIDWDRMDAWSAGCGPQTGKCFRSYSVKNTTSGHLRRLTFRKVKGCVNPKKVRLYAEFRSSDLSDPNGQTSRDQAPGKRNRYTKWVKRGSTRLFVDRR